MTETGNNKKHDDRHNAPSTGTFVILLITLWALNFADIFQTLYLKQSGMLALEANYFVDFFLRKGGAPFFWAKVLALVLVTSMLIRGWIDRKGISVGNLQFTPESGRRAIQLLLIAGVLYYTLIVVFPFIALAMSGLFASTDQPMP
jgi:hypothetical protein